MPTVYSLPWFFQQFCDSNGDPLDGGKVRCKNAGTSDDKDTYSDSDGTTPNANPVILDSSGMAVIFLESGTYDFYVYDSDDNLIKTIEGINSQTTTTQVDTMADLKALPAGSSPVVRTLGYSAINDGGGWWYYWAASSTATNDDGMVIIPDSLPSAGRWLGIMPHDKTLNLRVYGATCDGVVNDYTELNSCSTWCAANDCTILIDSNTYIDYTSYSFSAPMLLLPSVVLSWDDTNGPSPTITLKTLPNDYTQHFSCNATYPPVLDVNELYYEWFGETQGSHSVTDAAIALVGGKPKILNNIDSIQVDGVADIEGNVDINGTLTTHDEVRFTGPAQFGSPTGGYKGNGTINAEAVYDDNVLLTGYVFDKAYNKYFDIKKWEKKSPPVKEFIRRHDMVLNVDECSEFIKSRKMLPTFEDIESTGKIPSTGAMIQKLWEALEIQAVHIQQLNDRLKSIEGKKQ